MNNKGREKIWGLVFIVVAALILLRGFGILGNIFSWKIIVAAFLVLWLIDGVKRRDWGSVLFPVAFLIILFAKKVIPPMSVIGAAIFGTIGLGFLFGKKQKDNDSDYIEYRAIETESSGNKGNSETTSDNTFTFSTSFNSGVKYVKADNFERANINCSFGEVKVYFDDAQIHCDEAIVNVDNKFGSVNLYFPKEWYVTNEAIAMFGGVEEKNRSITNGTPKVKIVGNIGFGNITVTYI